MLGVSLEQSNDCPLAYREKNNHSILILAAVLLFATVSILDIFRAKTLYPTPEIYASFFPDDAINPVFGTIALLLSHFKVVRGSKFYLPCRSGILLFILYNAIASVYAMRSALSILLLILGVAALLTLVESVEYQKLLGTQPTTNHPKLYAAILICMALLFLVRAIILLVRGDTQQPKLQSILQTWFSAPCGWQME